jgi:hypothetical protein
MWRLLLLIELEKDPRYLHLAGVVFRDEADALEQRLLGADNRVASRTDRWRDVLLPHFVQPASEDAGQEADLVAAKLHGFLLAQPMGERGRTTPTVHVAGRGITPRHTRALQPLGETRGILGRECDPIAAEDNRARLHPGRKFYQPERIRADLRRPDLT